MYEFLLIAGVALWIVMAVIYARSGVASIFHPATYYMFFQGFIFVVRPILAYLGDYQFVYTIYSFYPTIEAKITALLVADLGFVVFMAAVLRTGRTSLILSPTRDERADEQRRYITSLLVVTALLSPLGVYSLYYVLQSGNGEVMGMTFDAGTGATISTSGNGYLFTAGDLVGALSVLLAWQFRFRFLAVLPFTLYVFTRASIGGMRWAFLLTSATLALLWLYDRRRRWPSIPILSGGLALLALFAVIGEQRDIVKAYLTGGVVNSNLFEVRTLEGMDYANLEYLEYHTLVVPDKTGTWGYFADNLQVVTEPIPRVLWRGKPIGPPIKMWDFFDYGTPIGMTASMVGEGWDQLGYVGVALWSALWGWLFGLLYNAFVRRRQTGFLVGTYMLILPLSIQFFRDGGLLTMLKFPMWTIITVLLWMLVSKLMPATAAHSLNGRRDGARISATR